VNDPFVAPVEVNESFTASRSFAPTGIRRSE